MRILYYFNQKSSKKIVHSQDCFRIANSENSNIGLFKTLDDAYEAGYRLCRNCSPIAKKYKREENEIMEFCRINGMIPYFHDKFVGITSVSGKWKITVNKDGKQICLFHKNEYKSKHDNKSPIPGFHLQKACCDSIMGYLSYISKHDSYRRKNPLYIFPKEKPLPRKGTRRYREEQKKVKIIANKRAIRNVLDLIESLPSSTNSAV